MARSSLTIGDLLFRLGYDGEEKFVADLDKILNQADKKVTKESEKTGKKGGQTAGEAFSKQFKATFSGAALGSFLGTALAQAFSGAVAATTRFVADSLNEYKVYEQGLLQLKLAGETNLAALSKRIHDVARASRVFSATDVSLAVGDLVKAGYDAETAFALVETGVLGAASEVDAATGSFGDLGNTAVQLGNILRALGYDVSQSGRVMDVMARAAQDSNLDVSDLVDIISRVGPTAKLAGLEIEDLAAAAAVLSNNGMDASLIGTGLRSVLQSLINPSAQVKGELDKLGISLVDNQGNLRDFNDVLDGLHELTQRGGEGLQILTQATGSYGSTAASSLGTASEAVKEFRTTMENAEGAAQELADTMRNSGAGSAAEYAARMADARAELGERLMPHMVTMYETVLPALVSVLGGLIEKWEQWYFLLTGTTTAIQQAEQALASQVRSGLGEELGNSLLTLMDARQAVAELEQKIASLSPLEFGARARYQRQLNDAIALRDAEQERYDALVAQRRLEQQHQANLANWSPGDQFGPQGMPEGWTPQQINELADAYRNLATIQAELKEAQDMLANASGPEEEARLRSLVASLKAEEEARKRTLGLIEERARAATAEKDPLAEEAQRIQNDLQRLKLGYEQGNLTLAQYVEQQEAHLRRLDGLLERAGTPQQSQAVLRARKAFLDELERLDMSYGRRLSETPGVTDVFTIAGVTISDRPVDPAAEARRHQEVENWRAVQAAVEAYGQALANVDARLSLGLVDSEGAMNERLQANEHLLRAIVPLYGTLTSEQLAYVRTVISGSEELQEELAELERQAARQQAYQESQFRRQAEDDRPSITSQFGTPEELKKWLEEQRREEVEAEKKKQEELARLRKEALESVAKALGEARADVREVAAEANRLGIAITEELRDGTLEGLQEIEAELVQLLSELGDDPSAAPLMGLLTRTRSAISNVTEATRQAESEQRRLIRAHNEYTESLKRARQAETDRAMGSTVRLTQAQRTLGLATRDDVIAAVEEQISTLDRLLPTVTEGSERYYEFVAALEAARAALAALNAEVPAFKMPDLGSAEAIRRAFTETENMVASLRERVAAETDQSVIALLEVRIQQYTELLRQLGVAVADLDKAAADGATGDEIQKQAAAMASDLMRVAESFPRALVEGVRSGDLAGALEQALGGAADYFLDMMLKSILGPITEELTAAIAKSLTAKAATDGAAGATGALGALGPTGLVIGGVALLASMLVGASRSRQRESQRNQQNVRSAVSGAPSVTYNISAEVNVAPAASFGDPRWEAELRSFIQQVATDLYRRVPRTGGGG